MPAASSMSMKFVKNVKVALRHEIRAEGELASGGSADMLDTGQVWKMEKVGGDLMS